jgi:hypothetical protein
MTLRYSNSFFVNLEARSSVKRSNSITPGGRRNSRSFTPNKIDYKELLINKDKKKDSKNNVTTNIAIIEQINQNDYLESFFIQPFFFKRESMFKIDADKIHDLIQMKYDDSHKKHHKHRIFENVKDFDLEKIPSKYNRYLIPELAEQLKKEKEKEIPKGGKAPIMINKSSKINPILAEIEKKLESQKQTKEVVQYTERRKHTFINKARLKKEAEL